MPTPGAPRLTVVVAASNGPVPLASCLEALLPQLSASDEVVVASNFGEAAYASAALATLQWVSCPPGTTVPQLRSRGIAQATGDLVALIEDNSAPAAGWSEALRTAAALPYEAFGGSVAQATPASACDWATCFYEYGAFLLPHPGGPVDRLPGNNLCYRREVLNRFADQYADGFYAAFFHDLLRAEGIALYLIPEATVIHTQHYETRERCWACYHHGRAYAGMRVAKASGLHRALMTAGAGVLPVLLPARIARQVGQKKRYLRPQCRSFPHLVLFMTCWAVGEMMGYAAGAGTSADKWT